MRIDTAAIGNWRMASKTRPIKAKPLISLLVDRSVASKFLLDTLEGREPLGDGAVVCVGEAGDAWQQAPRKPLQKYAVKGIDKDGWMECEPLPDNAVNCVEVTEDMLATHQSDDAVGFTIVGQWGATVGGEKNVQRGEAGDFICQNQTDPSDVWVVRRKLFLNTYMLKS
jgi:hypothetical protein